MNRYDERYDFYFAKAEDIDDIMEYIDTVWKKGHILATDREFFEYEFRDGEDVHFLIARDRLHNNIIAAINGYYPCSKDKEHFDIWGCMWSARKDNQDMPMLGVEIGKRLYNLGHRSETGLGNNQNTAVPIQGRFFKDKTGKLEQYYMLNEQTEYRIADIKEPVSLIGKEYDNNPYCMKRITDFKEIEANFDFTRFKENVPYKDGWYINKRFFNHPVYTYKVYGVYNRKCGLDNVIDALTTFKKVVIGERSVLRLVDFTGDKAVIPYLYKDFKGIMTPEIEYIDFYCYGFEEDALNKAGFIKRTGQDINIIPNYFDPFVRENVDIWFNTTQQEGITICKADSDQDRPNRRV